MSVRGVRYWFAFVIAAACCGLAISADLVRAGPATDWSIGDDQYLAVGILETSTCSIETSLCRVPSDEPTGMSIVRLWLFCAGAFAVAALTLLVASLALLARTSRLTWLAAASSLVVLALGIATVAPVTAAEPLPAAWLIFLSPVAMPLLLKRVRARPAELPIARALR